jgi:two-component system sensor histidine kinase CpxA
MRQGLFLKIFTWFWLTVILTGVAIEGTSAWIRNKSRVHNATFEKLLPQAARGATDALEEGGESGLAEYLSRLQQAQSVMAFFFDVRGEERTHRWTPPAVRDQGILAVRAPGLRRSGRDGEIAAQHVMGSSGQNYALVLVMPRNVMSSYWDMPAYWRLAIIIVISGIFCFLIARHVTAPLFRLQTAAADIAEGRLSARVSADLHRRGDEIAGLARDFNRMATRIEALVHGQKQLLTNVSHELRSPLSRLLVALSLAKQRANTEAGEHLERIGAEAHRLEKLIGQLLMLSRIDSTVDDEHRAAIDLTALVDEVARDADFEGQAHGRRVTVTADPNCVLSGSEEALRSALENIVRNAVRYTAEGTEVEVSLRREADCAQIRVRDHGPGVPEHKLLTIFVPFRRGDDGAEGYGLGLAIAERAVATHRGSVSARNAQDGGLVVDVCLPVA